MKGWLLIDSLLGLLVANAVAAMMVVLGIP